MRVLLMAVAMAVGLGSVAQADPPKDSKRPSREEMKKRFMEKMLCTGMSEEGDLTTDGTDYTT